MSGFWRYYIRPKKCSGSEWLQKYAFPVALPSEEDFKELKAQGISILVALTNQDGKLFSISAACLDYERLVAYATFQIVGNPPPKLYIVNNENLRHDTGLTDLILKGFPVYD